MAAQLRALASRNRDQAEDLVQEIEEEIDFAG
jgi:hypothetical protein